MSNPEDRSWANGLSVDPLKRLPSFKAPRDLSLGGIKPNKKVFAPNLNVTRNKTKGSSAGTQKKEDKNKKDHKNNKNKKNGPVVIKSSGVFSEGLGSVEKRSSRKAYIREDSTSTLERPNLRINRAKFQINNEVEDCRIEKLSVGGGLAQEDDADFRRCLELDAPIKLPMGDAGYWRRVTKPKIKVKLEYECKTEPEDDEEIHAMRAPEQKPLVDFKQELSGDVDLLDMLKSNDPTLILLQLPTLLPGRGGPAGEEPPPRAAHPAGSSAAPSAPSDDQKPDEECHLSSLEEGRIGKLNVHRSGRVTLSLGKSVFEVQSGVKPSFHQEVVSMGVDDESRSANLISLGVPQHKLIVFPHWEGLLPGRPA